MAKSNTDYDFVLIGAGAAGFAAAIRAREAGARVAMIEAARAGGTCVNIGGVPSKTLLRALEVQYKSMHRRFAGIKTFVDTPDLSALIKQKNELVEAFRLEKYERLVHLYGWDLLYGVGRFIDNDTVMVNGEKIRAQFYLIATGASPSTPLLGGSLNPDTSPRLLHWTQKSFHHVWS